MTVWTENAARFTTRRDDVGVRLDVMRRAGVREAMRLIVAGQPGRALYELHRSVRRQALLAGIGELQGAAPVNDDGLLQLVVS